MDILSKYFSDYNLLVCDILLSGDSLSWLFIISLLTEYHLPPVWWLILFPFSCFFCFWQWLCTLSRWNKTEPEIYTQECLFGITWLSEVTVEALLVGLCQLFDWLLDNELIGLLTDLTVHWLIFRLVVFVTCWLLLATGCGETTLAVLQLAVCANSKYCNLSLRCITNYGDNKIVGHGVDFSSCIFHALFRLVFKRMKRCSGPNSEDVGNLLLEQNKLLSWKTVY